MTIPPPSPNPFGPDAPTEDHVGLAVSAIGAAACAGVAWFSGLTFVGSRMAAASTATSIAQVSPNAPYVNLLVYGTLVGMGFTAIVAWLLMSPIPSTYRRGALSVVAAFGGGCLAMISTWFAHALGGPMALIGLGVVAIAFALMLGRRAVQAAR